jgi:hypothetical protein
VRHMQSTQRISFHESSLVGSFRVDTTTTLKLEGVHVEGNTRNVSIRLEHVNTVLVDGTELEDFPEVCENGEILTLEYTQKSLYMIVECTDFKNHKSQTHSYRIGCDSLNVEIH